jgi:hypothetical protein
VASYAHGSTTSNVRDHAAHDPHDHHPHYWKRHSLGSLHDSVEERHWMTAIPAAWIVSSSPEEELHLNSEDSAILPLLPNVQIPDMASALCWTCMFNHQLQHAVADVTTHSRGHPNQLRGGGGITSTPYRIPWTRRNSDPSSMEPLFRSSHPQWEEQELQEYLLRIRKVLGEHENDRLERTLTLLYLDRASALGLPYCTPWTVQYLCLTAMMVAAGAVRGDAGSCHHPLMQGLYQRVERELGVPVGQSQRRVETMWMALQQEETRGIFVTPGALQEWKEQWEARFYDS